MPTDNVHRPEDESRPASAARREFLRATTAGVLLATTASAAAPKGKPVNVLVWDERQPQQKQAYDNFLGNQIADHLKDKPGLSVTSVGLDDDEKGLSPAYTRNCDVLIWWGHVRNADVTPAMAKPLVDRIKDGTLSLIALHSAHWSTPFVGAMYERTRMDAEKALKRDGAAVDITYVDPVKRYTVPKATDRLTPYVDLRRFPDGTEKATVYRPTCCFPAYRADGRPSQIRVLKPDHPIAKGLPAKFELPRTEMYAEPFHVPEPDEVVLEERWASGDWFRSGMVWALGRGKCSTSGRATRPMRSSRRSRSSNSWRMPSAGSPRRGSSGISPDDRGYHCSAAGCSPDTSSTTPQGSPRVGRS